MLKREILDGNTAVAKASYKLSEISFIYPITPSSTMAEVCDEMANAGEKNIFGSTMSITEMQSEGGASGALHGASIAGSVATTFTSSQGLLLMLPNMYKIAGEMLPVVINVASRSLATHALNIFCDHSDVMSARQTGFAMLSSASPQEAYDFAVASFLTSIKTRVPFLHFFDGFRTSHEINVVNTFEDEELKKIYPFEKLQQFKQNGISPNSPHQYGTSESEDIFFQGRERANEIYNTLPDVLNETFKSIEAISGRQYKCFEYYGSKTAKYVLVVMGSATNTIKQFIDFAKNKDYGVLKVNLYRPFSAKMFVDALPIAVQKMAVLDRVKEQGSVGEPLYEDVCASLMESNRRIKVVGGRYGLGGKEFNPAMVKAIFENLEKENAKNHFTIGIDDDITHTSLNYENFEIADNCFDAIFFGLGSDGTVSSSKNIIKILGKDTQNFVQAYFAYDSKKSGGLTRSFLRIDKKPIEKPYLISKADFVMCNNASFLSKYNMASFIKPNGVLLVNSPCKTTEEIDAMLIADTKILLAKNKIKLYSIDASKIARQNNLSGKISTIMQVAFFYLSKLQNFESLLQETASFVKKTFTKKGKQVVENNLNSMTDIPSKIVRIDINNNWQNLLSQKSKNTDNPYLDNYLRPIINLQGNSLSVSQINKFGQNEVGTSKFEKRNISNQIPKWFSEKCLQCGKCSFVCPHAVLRAKMLSEDEIKNAPKTLEYAKCFADKNKFFTLEISPEDCTACGRCESVCPVKEKAIKLCEKKEIFEAEKQNYNYTNSFKPLVPNLALSPIKAQYMPPYFEFSGACAGCGEGSYIRLLTQLFGNHLIMANATGCSSIFGGSAPTCPYTKDVLGQGTAWANSLFEDNAEFGMGIKKSVDLKRESLKNFVQNNLNTFEDDEFEKLLKLWLENFDNFEICEKIYLELKNNKYNCEKANFVFENLDSITPKTIWLVGGDGWAYDIDFGGLDHVMASGEDINILVLDTELYSNTGGQMSKSTQVNSIAKFCSAGKKTAKKRLALMAMSYKNVYVSQICLSANMSQTLKAFDEAQKHKGVSIIIAYAPCINHGVDMTKGVQTEIDAVESGYWHLFRYNPDLIEQGKNPLTIDSKAPTTSLENHLLKERRFANFYEKSTQKETAFNKIKAEQDEFYSTLLSIKKSFDDKINN